MQIRLYGFSRCKHDITWKQIQIIDTLVAKFRKAHDATPQHDTFKRPKQASLNPSNFGDTWKYLCSSAASSWSLEGSMCQLMDTPSGAACGKGFVSERSCRNYACRTTAEQQQLILLASCRVQHKSIGNYLPQTPKKIDFGSKLEAKNWSQKWSHFWLRLMKQ